MPEYNPEEDAMIEKIDGEEILALFEILRVDIEKVVEAIFETRKAGLIPVSVGMQHPELTILGIPIIFEENAGDDIVVYSQDRSQLN